MNLHTIILITSILFNTATAIEFKDFASQSCSTCAGTKELGNQCPAILSDLIKNDKADGMYGLKKNKYYECTQDIMAVNRDYKTREDLKRDIEKHLKGKLTTAMLNNVNKCPGKETPDARAIIGKSAYSLLRLEKGQRELYDQIAFSDFVNNNPVLEKEDCSNLIFNSVEKQCNKLKTECFSNKTKERNDFFALTEKIETNVKKLEQELSNKALSKDEAKNKTNALNMMKLKYPWVFGNNFKKSRANGKSTIEATKKEFAANRKSASEKLKDIQNKSLCFYDSDSSFCDPQKIVATIEETPEIDFEIIDGNTAEEKNNQNFWNSTMRAQRCLMRTTDSNNKATDMLNEGLGIAVLTIATYGMGEAVLLARTAQGVRALAATSFAAQAGVDTYFAIDGVQNAFHACTGHDVSKIESSNSPTACPLADNINKVSYAEQESCKMEIMMALAGGVPLATGIQEASRLAKDPQIKKALGSLASVAREKVAKASHYLFNTTEMITDRNISQTLSLFGNSPALKSAFDSSSPLKIATLGAGKGVSAEQLANKGHHVTAVEINGTTEKIVKTTEKGGSITRHNGTDASRAGVLERNSYDLFYETHGANAYTDRPDLLTQSIVDALKKDGKYFAFGGGDKDNWAINNKIVLENGDVVNYLDWIKTIPGIKVETQIIPGKLDESGHLISPSGSYFVITKTSDNVKIPELNNMYREKDPSKYGRIVPHQTFAVKAEKKPTLHLPKTEGPTQHFVSQGLPTDQLKNLAAKGKGSQLTISGGPTKGGVLSSTKIKLKNGNEIGLDEYLEKIPGIKVNYTKPKEAYRYVETRDKVKVFTGAADEIKTNFRVTEKVQMRDMQISVTDPVAVENYLKEHSLDLAGIGKQAPIKFDEAGNPIEQVRAPYFVEK